MLAVASRPHVYNLLQGYDNSDSLLISDLPTPYPNLTRGLTGCVARATHRAGLLVLPAMTHREGLVE
jgi:hypothetical protein